MVHRLTRRIPRTGEFVTSVLNDRSLFDAHGEIDPNSDAYKAIRYIRILHAAVRHMLLLRWDENIVSERGIPINQMDLAGTVLAFALVVDQPLQKINGHSDPTGRGENAYLDKWNAIGVLMGVEPQYLARDIFSARA